MSLIAKIKQFRDIIKSLISVERKKKRKSLLPHTHVIRRFVGLSEYDFIKKMRNKNHLDKVPSKAAERSKKKGPHNTTGY